MRRESGRMPRLGEQREAEAEREVARGGAAQLAQRLADRARHADADAGLRRRPLGDHPVLRVAAARRAAPGTRRGPPASARPSAPARRAGPRRRARTGSRPARARPPRGSRAATGAARCVLGARRAPRAAPSRRALSGSPVGRLRMRARRASSSSCTGVDAGRHLVARGSFASAAHHLPDRRLRAEVRVERDAAAAAAPPAGRTRARAGCAAARAHSPEHVQRDLPAVRAAAVLPDVEPLPGAERQLAVRRPAPAPRS